MASAWQTSRLIGATRGKASAVQNSRGKIKKKNCLLFLLLHMHTRELLNKKGVKENYRSFFNCFVYRLSLALIALHIYVYINAYFMAVIYTGYWLPHVQFFIYIDIWADVKRKKNERFSSFSFHFNWCSPVSISINIELTWIKCSFDVCYFCTRRFLRKI